MLEPVALQRPVIIWSCEELRDTRIYRMLCDGEVGESVQDEVEG